MGIRQKWLSRNVCWSQIWNDAMVLLSHDCTVCKKLIYLNFPKTESFWVRENLWTTRIWFVLDWESSQFHVGWNVLKVMLYVSVESMMSAAVTHLASLGEHDNLSDAQHTCIHVLTQLLNTPLPKGQYSLLRLCWFDFLFYCIMHATCIISFKQPDLQNSIPMVISMISN